MATVEPWLTESKKDCRLEDNYDEGQQLGRGASSVVYLVRCKKTGVHFAAKKVKKHKQVNKTAVRSEISILLRLKHPNVIALHEIYESSLDVTLILEYVTGGELFDRIVQKGCYSEKDAVHVMRQILEALEYLHEKGIVHRDLKPENLLYENEQPNSRLKLADFGLSKISTGDVTMQTMCGTLGYCAPEVLQRKKYDASVDMWSAGVITYILLCGYEPFYDDRGQPVMLDKAMNGDYTFDSPWWDEISMSVKDLISELIQVDPKQRLTARQALGHAWLRGEEANETHLRTTISKLREFNAKRKLRAATQAVMATRRVLLGVSGTKESSIE